MIDATKLNIGDTIEINGVSYEVFPPEKPNHCLGCEFDTVDVFYLHEDCDYHIFGCNKTDIIFKKVNSETL